MTGAGKCFRSLDFSPLMCSMLCLRVLPASIKHTGVMLSCIINNNEKETVLHYRARRYKQLSRNIF